ncbi:hypothetical protein CW751_03615 [Brumimicrobium salinarum]|uniref:Thioredoxin-like fold domain-containing protein n=2 Tax=Brumimicrobium salinarum TaxID=2058658 RepID=A0A2I0R4W5_9FLAO|nr:hypothetical protein CW751_03615 [Brumimicrobium salinarum]
MLLSFIQLFAQPVTTISGIAESYVGEEVKVFTIDDYLSRITTQVASTTVQKDSTFKVSFFNKQTRKLRIEVGKNHFHIYTQPKAKYKVFVSESSPYIDANAERIEVEFFFLDLPKTDINYKILMFEDAQLSFLEEHYYHKSLKSVNFVSKLDTFKNEISQRYATDTSKFFHAYMRYSFASIDNLSFLGQRNAFEKYDFYIKPETVLYQNDRYMDYILHYYKLYETQLPNEVNELFYKGVVNSSPTIILNALGGDIALKNIRLRELIMIRMLSEVFYTNIYPQTNVLTVLDSVANHAIFDEHKKIAKNIKFRLLDLVPGSEMPDFNISVNGTKKYNSDYRGKHLYIHFANRNVQQSIDDLKLISLLKKKYGKHIQFLTILTSNPTDTLLNDASSFIKTHNVSWDLAVLSNQDPLLERLNVSSYPHYLLLDAAGNVVASPALLPRPNNEYETIENIFVRIERRYRLLEQRE